MITQRSTTHSSGHWIDVLFLVSFLGTLYFALLGIRPLFTPDEGRYAEIGREMINNHDYITPYLNGIRYFEKPPLFYWLETLAIKLGGLNLWSVRSVNALLGLMGCLLTYLTARVLYNRTTALLAALILGTSLLYFVMTNMVSLDLPVTVFIAANLYTFLLGSMTPTKKAWYFASAGAFAGLAVLTKGLMGIVLPGMIVLAWSLILNQWTIFKKGYWFLALTVFLSITLPWHILVSLKNPEFFNFYFINQHIQRYTVEGVGHYQPVWFFIPYLLLGFFPWSVFLPQTLTWLIKQRNEWRQSYQTEFFCLLWILIIFSFFSFSKSKLVPYILPIFPPLALLTARYLQQAIQTNKTLGMKIGCCLLVFISLILGFIFYQFSSKALLPDPIIAQRYFLLAFTVLVTGSSLTTYFVFKTPFKALSTLGITVWIFLLFILAAIPAIDQRSVRPLAQTLNTLMKPNDEVIAYNQYYQDLPFYLQKKVTILNWQNELKFGMQYQDTRQWMIDDHTFRERWTGRKRIFLIMGVKSYGEFLAKHTLKPGYLIHQTVNNVLLSNQKS